MLLPIRSEFLSSIFQIHTQFCLLLCLSVVSCVPDRHTTVTVMTVSHCQTPQLDRLCLILCFHSQCLNSHCFASDCAFSFVLHSNPCFSDMLLLRRYISLFLPVEKTILSVNNVCVDWRSVSSVLSV